MVLLIDHVFITLFNAHLQERNVLCVRLLPTMEVSTRVSGEGDDWGVVLRVGGEKSLSRKRIEDGRVGTSSGDRIFSGRLGSVETRRDSYVGTTSVMKV